MSAFVEIRALGGASYVRAAEVIAVQYLEPQKCNVLLSGGASLSCAEPATQIRARMDAALQTQEMTDGDASR